MPVNHLVDTREENVVKPRVGKAIVYKDALAFLNSGSGDVDNRTSNTDPPFHHVWNSQAVGFWLHSRVRA